MRRVTSVVLLASAICASAAVRADHPSLEGTWTNATLTSLQRPARYTSLIIPASEVAAQTAAHPQVVRQRTDDQLDESKPLNGSDLKDGRGYNAFWIDPGMTFARVKGEYRTSWIVHPPDGQIPFSEGVRERLDAGRGNFDGPEARPLGERCIINSNSAGPPMLNYLYNNNYEFVQTADALVIRAEMNNYARVVRIGRPSSAAGRPRLAWRLHRALERPDAGGGDDSLPSAARERRDTADRNRESDRALHACFAQRNSL